MIKKAILCLLGAFVSALLIGISSMFPIGFAIPLVSLFSITGMVLIIAFLALLSEN